MLSLPATPPCPPVQAHCPPHNNKHPGRSVPPLGSRAGTWSRCTWFWRKFLMAVLFCRQNFHHSIFLSSDYLLKNIFSDGDLPSWPSPLHRVHSRFWVHLFKNCERKDIHTQKRLKNRRKRQKIKVCKAYRWSVSELGEKAKYHLASEDRCVTLFNSQRLSACWHSWEICKYCIIASSTVSSVRV